MYCTECSKRFIAKLDLGLDGNHVIECPWCGHEHCRVVKDGKVTEDRWSSRAQNTHRVERRHVWKHDSLPAQTSSASWFIHEMWLDRMTQ